MSENRPQMTVQSAVEVVAAVVDVEQGEKVLRIYREEQAPVDFVCMAHGTARTEMLDLLGIGETAKAIVMCMVSRQTGVRLLKRLGRELEMRYPGRGIAFAIPITGIGLRWHKLLTAADEEQKEVSRMHETEKNDGFDVVAVVMERGYTNVAMDAARKAGARGGTVISARGIAENEVKRFFGIEIQAEKEIVFLVVRSDEKQQVMTALMQAVIDGKLDYTIADSVAVSLFQRVHPELAVALDITDEQPVTWFSARDDDNSLSAAMLDFFNNINEDGTLARLEEKYLGHGNDFDYVDTRTFLRAVENILPEVQPLFEKYAREIDWRLLAAIAWQESHWDPQATSPTGVRGMMMLTRNTAQSLGLTDRTDAAQSIDGGMRYLQDMMDKVPDSIPKDERIWFALAAYNMGYAHMLDAMALTRKQKGNPNSWADVKLRLPLLSQKPYYSKLKYGYARGHEAYAYVENIRKYQISLVGYLSEKERQQQQTLALAEDYPAVLPNELEQPQETTLPFFKFRADKQMDNARMKLPGHLY